MIKYNTVNSNLNSIEVLIIKYIDGVKEYNFEKNIKPRLYYLQGSFMKWKPQYTASILRLNLGIEKNTKNIFKQSTNIKTDFLDNIKSVDTKIFNQIKNNYIKDII